MRNANLLVVHLLVLPMIFVACGGQSSAVANEPQASVSRRTRLTVVAWDGALPSQLDGSSMFSDWWEAARNFHFDYGTGGTLPDGAQPFLDALALLVEGRLTDADSILDELVRGTHDQTMLANGTLVLALLYQEMRDSEALLELVQRYPALVEGGVIEESDTVAAREALTSNRQAMVIELPDYPTRLPISFAITGTPMLEVEVNGIKEHFWLDTGSSGSLIASNVAEQMEVQLVGEQFEVDNLGTTLPLRRGFIDSLSMGPVTVRDLPVAVLDHTILTIGPYPIAGIIGWPILRELRMEFDYGAETVTIERSDGRPSSQRNFFWFDYPFVRLYTPDGVPLYFGLDTGADVTRIKANIFQKLPDFDPEEITAAAAALGGQVIEQRVQMLTAARFFVRDVRLDFANIKTTDGVNARFVAPDGRLGADVFRDGVVVMDFPAGEFRIVVRGGG